MAELGIGDPGLVGYVADLLARFVPSQDVWQVRDAQGRRLTEVAAMVAEAEASADADRRRECHRHVGDFTLFWTGVYPEALGKLRAADSADHLVNYQAQGKRSYYLASTLGDDEAAGPPPPERRVRALRLRPVPGPPRVGAARPRAPRGPSRAV